MTIPAPKKCEVKAHTRTLPPSPLYNPTSLQLMRETGFVPNWFKPRVRVKAGRKVQ